ncbi:MAG: preprotein translocase subunit YajC [Bacteroidota bacterium]|nr:preprotein translocase subunit YajC [Bacteroidota bacterium]
MTNILNVLLMMPQEEGQSPYSTFIFLGLIVVVFYFFMIRPQMKKQKELTNFRNELGKGDKIVTTGGIYGKIIEVKEASIVIDCGDDVKLKVDKNAVVKDASDLAGQR